MNYYISDAGAQRGPYTKQQLARMWDLGAVTAEALYTAEGMTEWRRLEELLAVPQEELPRIDYEPLGVRLGRALGRKWGIAKLLANRARSLFDHGKAAAVEAVATPTASEPASGEPHRVAPSDQRSGPATAQPPHRKQMLIGVAVASVVALFAMIIAITFALSTSSPVSPSHTGTPAASATATTVAEVAPPPLNRYPEELQESLTAHVTERLKANKQRLFDGFHPVGRATDIKLSELRVRWKDGTPHRRWEDLESYSVRCVLYWEGPINKDGYSEFEFVYDAAIDRIVSQRVLRSNGITREELGNAAGDLAADLLRQWSENR